MEKKIYQVEIKHPETKEWVIPNDLYSFQVFGTRREAEIWIEKNINPTLTPYRIFEYNESDIEGYTLIPIMEKTEFYPKNTSLHRLTYFNDNVSIARSEMIRLLAKPEKCPDGLRVGLAMHIDCGDSITIVPFELRVPKVSGEMYNFSQCKIYTTNKDFSQRIKDELTNSIAEMRKANRKA